MNRKFLVLLAQCMVAVTLVACGGGDPDGGTPPLAPSSQTQQVGAVGMARPLGVSVVDAAPSELVNQAVNLQDAIAILKMIVGLDVNAGGQPTTAYQLFAADFDGNGKVELADAISVLKRVVGLDSRSPKWMFFQTRVGADPVVVDKLNPGLLPELSAGIGGAVGMVAVLRGDVVGGALSYAWTLGIRPAGSAAAIAGSSFIADVVGDYVMTMTVTDDSSNRASAAATLTAAANAAPTANAGTAQSISAGSLVTLDGSISSDPNRDPLNYTWALISRPAGSVAALNSSTSIKPTFLADVAGVYIASLVVNDGKSTSNASSVTITAAVANIAPVARLGSTSDIIAGAVVNLNGTSSSDANGDRLTYAWSLISKPAGSAAVIGNTVSSMPSFTTDLAGSYIASLVVFDGKLVSLPATVTVNAKSIEFDKLLGAWDAIANNKSFTSQPNNLSISIAAGVLTIRAEQFFDGTCLYMANLTILRDGINSGKFQCSDFSTGNWELKEMQRVDNSDVYVRLTAEGKDKVFFGIFPNGSSAPQLIPSVFTSMIGVYDGIATGGPFSTESATPIAVSIINDVMKISIKRFFSGTCEYSARIQTDGKSIYLATYQCSDFSVGTWSLNDMRSVGGGDLFISLSAGGNLRRAYGLRVQQ
jgi:hypothetical protein